jgi:hypothetical protein
VLGGFGEIHMAGGDARLPGGLDPVSLIFTPCQSRCRASHPLGRVSGACPAPEPTGKGGRCAPCLGFALPGFRLPGARSRGEAQPRVRRGNECSPGCQVNPRRGCDGHAPISKAPALPATRPTVNLRPRLARGIATSPLPVAHAARRKPRTWPTTKSGPWVCNALKLEGGLCAASQAAGKRDQEK